MPLEHPAKLCHHWGQDSGVRLMLYAGLNRLQWFVGLMGASAILVSLWMAFVVLHRRRLERAAVILAAICAIMTAYLYVVMWGFSIAPL